MNSKHWYLINIGLTCILCMVMLTTCNSCSHEQLTQAQTITEITKTALQNPSVDTASQPWYILALLIADIASSIIAAWKSWKAKNP